MTTHCQLAFKLLKGAGSIGIHSFDLNRLIGTTRAAARIQDLKDQGYDITSVHERRGRSWGVRYFFKEPLLNQKKPTRYEFMGNMACPVYG